MVEVDAAELVQGHRERVGGRCRSPAWLGGEITRSRKIGPMRASPGFEVVVLDRGDQPAVGVVGERRQVGPAVGLALLAGLRVGADGDHASG